MVRDLIGCDKPSKKIFGESSLGLPNQRVFAQVSTIAVPSLQRISLT
jgi:hypothetical protein